MPFLAQGSGPYQGGVPGRPPPNNTTIIGQLDPWPGLVAPTPANCGTATLAKRQVANDTITTVVASESQSRGAKSYTITVQDSITVAPFPVLTLTGAAKQNPVGAITMTDLGSGMYTTTFQTHNALTSVTIVSSEGATSTISTFT